MRTVTAAYAKANLPELLAEVQSGKKITISRYHKPVAVLGPVLAARQQSRNSAREKVK